VTTFEVDPSSLTTEFAAIAEETLSYEDETVLITGGTGPFAQRMPRRALEVGVVGVMVLRSDEEVCRSHDTERRDLDAAISTMQDLPEIQRDFGQWKAR